MVVKQAVPLFYFVKQYLLVPIKMRIKKSVDVKLKGKNGSVSINIPVKTRPKKFKKKKPGFIYFLVIIEFLGIVNKAKINNGVIWSI